MTITYPLSFPSNVGLTSFKIGLIEAVSAATSPYDFSTQVYQYGGQVWRIEAALPLMRRNNAAVYDAFFLKLRGMYGTFLFGDPNATTPQGTWGGTPLVNGAAQTGNTLNIDGVTIGGTVKAGDYFQLGSGSTSRLYKIVTDATANGSGQVTLEFMPAITTAPADNATVTYNSAVGAFRLESNANMLEISAQSLYSFSFSAKAVV